LLSESMQEGSGSRKQNWDAAPNAFGRLSSLLDSMADELVNNPIKVRFMAQFDAMYTRDWPAERLMNLESQINPEGFQFCSELIRDGIADGSLRPDLDPDLTMHAVINAVIGAQRRLGSLGNKVEQEYGHPIDRLFREMIRVILLGLRAQESPTRRHPQKTKTAKLRTRKRSS